MSHHLTFNRLTFCSLTPNKLIWTIVIMVIINSSFLIVQSSANSIPNELSKKSEILTRRTIDTSDLYNISYFKLKTHVKNCLTNNQRAFADCVYNSETKWEQLTDGEEIKSSCCSFWESDQCVNQLVLELCPKDQSTLYIEDEDYQLARQFIRQGYCTSYQQLNDCIYFLSFWMVTIVSLIVTLIIIILIIILAVLYYYRRRATLEIADYHNHQTKSTTIKLPQQFVSLA